MTAFARHNRHDIAAACTYKSDVHWYPLERLGFCAGFNRVAGSGSHALAN
jgi:hypothetical protein